MNEIARKRKSLVGCLILTVEDEPLIAFDVHDALSAAGARVISATDAQNAAKLVQRCKISAAVLDINLGGFDCSPVCDALARRSIPFMFYTGYTNADATR